MRDEGLEQIFERHERLAQYTRDGLADLEVRLFADPRFASPTVTTAWLPEASNGKALLRALDERHDVVLAGGQGSLSGKIVRIGHMGWVEQDELTRRPARAPGRAATASRSQTARRAAAHRQPLVLVADPIAEEGLALLARTLRVDAGQRRSEPTSSASCAEADALLVRSETRVTAELLDAAPRLRVIGRAGAGVDTIDVGAATARGIVVVNAPGGNAVAAAEHTLALMFALARRVAAADASLKRGEWARGAYIGSELTGKTLGLVGLGRVGSEVARRALGLDMRVLVYDPYVPDEHVRRARPGAGRARTRCCAAPTSCRCTCR